MKYPAVNWIKHLAQDDISLAEAISDHAATTGVTYILMEKALFQTLSPYEEEHGNSLVLTSPYTGRILGPVSPMTSDTWWATHVTEIWREACFRALNESLNYKIGGSSYGN